MMLKNNKCCIVIPIYKEITDIDFTIIHNNTTTLSGNDIYIIAPNSLKLSQIITDYPYNILRFPDYYFKDNLTYSALLEQSFFWKSFSIYEYVLICQLDAWIFRNELDYFIKLGYDYYGGPWFSYKWYNDNNLYSVGNGGLSLRKVSKMIEVTEKYGIQCCDYKQAVKLGTFHDSNINVIYEDAYFCIEHKDMLNIAPFDIAIKFSFDNNPTELYELNNSSLPMGCHRFLNTNPIWWSNFIPILKPHNNEEHNNVQGTQEETIQ